MAGALAAGLVAGLASGGDDPMGVVRDLPGGGRWFPGNERELRGMVEGFISNAVVPKIEGRIAGGISPHAGYLYSGKVAGYLFRALRDNAEAGFAPDTVVVLGFSHQRPFEGVALLDGTALRTPLAETALDVEAAAVLTNASRRIRLDAAAHATEHSAANQVPFVQVALPKAKLVVAIIGDHDVATLRELSAGLGELARKKKIVVVASTDMLHDADWEKVTKTDKGTLKKLEAMDREGLANSWDFTNQIFCGICPVLTAMQYADALGCRKATVLYYRNSGDDFPESRGEWVVGYGAAVFVVPGAH